MDYPNCQMFGFNQSRIDEMLALLELNRHDNEAADTLQSRVIIPNIETIVDEFYFYLQQHQEFSEYFNAGEQLARLKQTQEAYLRSLGVGFCGPDYFEERLKIGIAHHRIGMPPRLYECAYAKLKGIITHRIYTSFSGAEENTLRYFLDRIITLDMSLALESYYQISIGNLEQSIDRLEKSKNVLHERSVTDTLTGAANRAAILGFINELLIDFEKEEKPFAIVMFDVDNLREVNFNLGHMAGDLVLKNIIYQVKSRIRSSDKIGRYGGDEFLLVFQNTSADKANKMMGDINEQLMGQSVSVRNKKIITQLSYGVSMAQKGDGLPDILLRVDKALTEASNRLKAAS